MIIAFMGNDGSGKTTLAKKFEKALIALGFKVKYRTEFDYFLIALIFRLLGTEKVNKYRRLFLAKKDSDWTPNYFKIWPYLVWIDLILELLWHKIFNRDTIIVMDRYAYDFLMSWDWLEEIDDRLKWLYKRFPKPSIAFIMDALPQTAYLRKKETHTYKLQFYEVQRKRYLNLAKTLQIKVINTEKPVEECLRETISAFRGYFIKSHDEDKVLLFYSCPWFKPFLLQELNFSFDWSRLNWDYIVDLAVKCSTENVLCTNIIQHHKDELPKKTYDVLNHVLGLSNARIELLHKTLKEVSRKLREKKVPFVVMKTIAPFDYGATDIDILVRQEDLEKAQESLSSIFEDSKSSIIHKAVTYQGSFLPVDLHHEISWLGNKVVDQAKVFDRKRKIVFKDVELFVPSIEDELLILSAHSLFQHHYTTLGEYFNIVHIVSKENVDSQYLLDSSNDYGWKNLLEPFLSYQAWMSFIIEDSLFIKKTWQKNPTKLEITPIFLHGFHLIPKRNPSQLLDLLLSLFRVLRFKLTRKLAYNVNWLN